MSHVYRIDLNTPSLLEFRGPDAVRFLNGQLTQDVRTVVASNRTLPSCVTDAKGKLQFRVWARNGDGNAILVEGPSGSAEALEARLTRYLIADDVDVADLSGQWSLVHFTGEIADAPSGVISSRSQRFGTDGTDWWIPVGSTPEMPTDIPLIEGDALEAYRIEHKVPAWGKELIEGILPPEAGLETTDISYHKGCYIGQEVISRIKSAGKVNKLLTQISFDKTLQQEGLSLIDANGKLAGEITSVSPISNNGVRLALAYIKRNASEVALLTADNRQHPVHLHR